MQSALDDEVPALRVTLVLAGRGRVYASSHRQPFWFLQTIFSPFAATPDMA